MANATDQQVQQYVDQRIRPRAEQIRALIADMQDDKAAIDDVYAACAAQSPTWADNRQDGPPHLLGPGDVLAFNAYITAAINNLANAADYPAVSKACVRPIGV